MDAEDITDIFDSSLTTIFDIPPIGFAPVHSTGLYTYSPSLLTSSCNGTKRADSDNTNVACAESESSTLGAHHRPIELRLPQPPSNLYTTLQANLIWPSALYLADLLVHGQINVKGKKVAELGAGAGLPGIVALVDGDAEGVVSTDWGVEEVLSVLADNFTRACKNDSLNGSGGQEQTEPAGGEGKKMSRWKVVGHQWGTDPSPLLRTLSSEPGIDASSSSITLDPAGEDQRPASGNSSDCDGHFDVLLLADVLWTTSSHSALLDSIANLLRRASKTSTPHPNQPHSKSPRRRDQMYGEAHITAGLHTGRGPVERFTASARERGMKVTMIREVRLGRNGWEAYDESMAKAGEEERGVVVYFTLRL
ncbi:hypothetical protein IAU59_007021 [Kwoniella sp. CBS 9459]